MSKYSRFISQFKVPPEIKVSDSKKEEKIIYEYYIEKTEQLYNHFTNSNLIELIIENDITIGRKFKKKNGDIGYNEIFIDLNIINFTQISENISLLYPPENKSDIIGYRFYEENPKNLKETKYFTLVLKYDNKFEILEKNSKIKDNEDNLFIINDLNCSQIIMKLIKNKFKNNINYPYPYTIIEILGFIYSMMNESSNIICLLEPFFPSFKYKNSFNEAFNESKKEEKIFVEPILFNNHISTLVFYYHNGNRENVLIDMSKQHYKLFKDNNELFPKDMTNNLFSLISFPIQYNNTCSIWFIGTILVLLSQKKLIEDERELIINIINKINEILNIEPVIELTKDKTNKKINILNINENDEYNKNKIINVSKDNDFIISHKIFLCPFLDIKQLENELIILNIKFSDILCSFHEQIEEIRKKIINIKLNKINYDIMNKSFVIQGKQIVKMEEDFNQVIDKCESLIELNFYKDEHNEKNNILIYIELKKNLKDTINKIYGSILENEKLPILFSNEELIKIHFIKNNIFLQILNS